MLESYEIEGNAGGPVALVTGGVHGDEPAGWHAAHHLTNFDVQAGRLHIIPEVNKEAIEKGSHNYSGGNLNRHFPINEMPASPLARELWHHVEEVNPDVFIDLHSSKGILGTGDDGIGQAVFHTPTDYSISLANIIEKFNTENILTSEYGRNYNFLRGRTRANSPMLYHKLSSEWGIPTYLIETTRKETDIETRTRWEADMATRLLAFHNVL